MSDKLPDSGSVNNISKRHNDLGYEEINNSEDLNRFLLSEIEEIAAFDDSNSDSEKETNIRADFFKTNGFKFTYVIKDNVFHIVKSSDEQVIKNETFNDKDFVSKKIFFNDKVSEKSKVQNSGFRNNSIWSISTEESQVISVLDMPPRTSLATSTCSSNQTTHNACNFMCCPRRLSNIVQFMKKTIVKFLSEDEEDDIFLDLKIRSIVTEMFCINQLLSKSLLVIYPDVLNMQNDRKELLFLELGYKRGNNIADYDKKLFCTLRRSFLVKYRKFKDYCKKWNKKTGEEFDQFEDNEIKKFKKNIDIINLILFETLLIDVGIV